MRLFIAIPLPPDVRRAVKSAQDALCSYGATGRFVPEENFHITLHFLGESDRLAEIASAMRLAVRDIRPFVLRLSGCGCFSRGDTKTPYVSVSCDTDELDRLYELLEYELYENGFLQNRSRLIPHITLGRSVAGSDGFVLARQTAAFRAGEIVLYESVRAGDRMRYTPVHREKLT